MMDIFDKIDKSMGPLGIWGDKVEGYFMFPKLEGEISNRMMFRGKERLVWSLNNYLGLANHPEVRKADAEAATQFGMAAPMGARMMSGQTKYHEQFEREAAEFEKKEAAFLLNFGYQGMLSIIDTLTDRKDVIVYDAESHACILDGMRLSLAKRFTYPHNDMNKLEICLQRAQRIVEKTGGGILVITEGVFGMSGSLGNLKGIAELKKKYNFRFLIDDAHGFGCMGANGRGTSEHFNVMDEVDIYFATFAKSMAGIGGFFASTKRVVDYLRFNMRSQIYAKSLPMPMTIGAIKRLELIRTKPELREKLWTIVNALQRGLTDIGINIGITKSPVTPVVLNGTEVAAINLAHDLRENYNIFCSIVVYPVIPKGQIILRLIPTAVHTLDDVKYTVNAFKAIKSKLDSGEYDCQALANLKEV
ncbi:MAG: aminotransferase class I/II-fold pyridoxal phosphate-dependent enzyme [Bacteroidales bacterium]|jgi:glycine C-acetyltransferase|nr:aminotransferase class I/II-fold pyridoxal phosphate-dependent enzyme [Bacteroidales bacterium]